MTTQTAPQAAAEASQHIFQIATGYIATTALYVATRLRIADRLESGARTVGELAAETKANEDALYRVLRLLASLGVFQQLDGRRFAHTPPSETLKTSHPVSTHPMMLWMSDPFHLKVYADAMHSVMTGQPAVEKAFGAPAFEYFRGNSELSEVFNDAMTAFSAFVIPAALDAYDFSGIDRLVDVAGGHDEVLTSILKKYPAMHGVLFDQAHVIEGAVPRIRRQGLESRCETVAGDFFESVPAAGDAYVMKHIIHDWDDDRAAAILSNIKKARKAGGRVILLESVLQPGNAADFGKLIDLEMLLVPGGRERTAAEFEALFAKAGLSLTRIVPTESPLSVIEAR